jgi:hexokinase
VEMIRDIAEAVQERSSALVATACVGLLNCVGDIALDNPSEKKEVPRNGAKGKREIEELVIAYAGGTISRYPKWLQACQKWIDILVEEGSASNRSKQVTLKEAKDGGIVGAGVLAGMAGEMA